VSADFAAEIQYAAPADALPTTESWLLSRFMGVSQQNHPESRHGSRAVWLGQPTLRANKGGLGESQRLRHKCLAYVSSAWIGALTVLVNLLVDERAQPSQG